MGQEWAKNGPRMGQEWASKAQMPPSPASPSSLDNYNGNVVLLSPLLPLFGASRGKD